VTQQSGEIRAAREQTRNAAVSLGLVLCEATCSFLALSARNCLHAVRRH
jgi:hypothetical protein